MLLEAGIENMLMLAQAEEPAVARLLNSEEIAFRIITIAREFCKSKGVKV